jgi:chloramphenicol-sensitive protein RarD
MSHSVSRGLWYGIGAYLLWGTFPIYFSLYRHVPAMEVLAHRIVWSFAVLVVLFAAWARRDGRGMTRAAHDIRMSDVRMYAVAAVFIGFNWFIYVWAVNSGFVVETSLGYFITPLVNVLLGVVVFRERLRSTQAVAVTLAAAGVIYLTYVYGSLPWIALGLAISFGTYGLVKKKARLDSLRGLTLETGILFLPALALLATRHLQGESAFLHTGARTDVLLAVSGIVTVIPLLLFGAAVRLIPLSMVGILQYIAPSMQFVLGVFVFGESFTRERLVGFALVWAALVLFAGEGVWSRRGVLRGAAEAAESTRHTEQRG